ncbi:TPA: hypothetical protein ACH3X1_001690 [Trebouxia sp. C0004]
MLVHFMSSSRSRPICTVLKCRMPAFVFNIRLDGKSEGCVKVTLEDGQSLKDARGLIVAQAAEQLGQQVLLRHFLVTVRGRTGYLEPQWEECSITGRASGDLLVINLKVCGGYCSSLSLLLQN